MAKIFNSIFKSSLYLLVFLLPVFFLPFSFEAYEFNKQYLLLFLASLAFLAWMGRMIICDKEIKIRRTPLDIPVLAFMFFAVLSTVFSIDKISSLFGFYGRFSDNLVSILSLGALYFLITNNVSLKTAATEKSGGERVSPASVISLLRVFLWSVFFVVLLTFFSFFGIWQMISKLTGGVLFSRIFNPIGGSLEGLAVFLMAAVVLLVGLLLKGEKDAKGKLGKISLGFLLFLITILLIIIDFSAVWVVLGLTLLLLLIFTFWSRISRERVNLLLIPIILIVISVAFFFIQVSRFNFQVSNYNVLNPPKEILLDQMTTLKVTLKAIKSSPTLGSGIGTFSFDFSKFKPQSFNQTTFWQLRFDKGANQIAEYVSTMGILGLLSWLVIVGMFLLVSWLFLQIKIAKIKTQSEKEESTIDNYQLPLFFTFLALFLSQFVYYQNITLAFTFWLVLGLSVVSWQKPIKEKTISFKDFPEIGLGFNMALILLLSVICGSWFFAVRFYLADINYEKGIIFGKTENFEKAVNLNKLLPTYRISLSRAYFTEALNEAQKPSEAQDTQKIQNDFAYAINEAKIATQNSPNWVVGFENLGMIYRDLRGIAQGVNQFAIESFQKAAELEPTNSVFNTEIGKILRDDNKIDEAKKEFEKALQLKPDYLDAEIQTALIFEQEKNLQEAISRLEEVVAKNPKSTEANFQLGRVYYNNNQIDKAISQFQLTLQIFPNHSNSLYALGLIYQKKGQEEEALKMFEKVLELNPGNQDVIAKINELKNPTPTP